MSTAVTTSARRSSLQITLAVWYALFSREILSRLMSQRAAWFWMLMEPLAHVIFAMILFSTLRPRSISQYDYPIFLAIGVMGFKLFTSTSLRSAQAIAANLALLGYKQVLAVDTVLVRAVLEGLITAVVTVLLFAGATLFGFETVPRDPLMLGLTGFLLWLMACGLGLCLAAINKLSPEVEKIIAIGFMPLYFLSGVLFSMNSVPEKYREILLYNPIAHGLELARDAFFNGYRLDDEVSLAYLAAWAGTFLLAGLVLQRRMAGQLGSS